ncbi:MAG: hypothetical protein FJ280_30885, partial [Planctomycetes bacterium]|nr:hypothetical protein [Planctomycetota bacterium]
METLKNKRGFVCDMDTDIVAGMESGIDTVLVLSGITAESDLPRYAYKPHYILKDISALAG